jgi:hypothetical protein
VSIVNLLTGLRILHIYSLFSGKRKVIQATDDVQIFVQENVDEDDDFSINHHVKEEDYGNGDEESTKVAETIITKLVSCQGQGYLVLARKMKKIKLFLQGQLRKIPSHHRQPGQANQPAKRPETNAGLRTVRRLC